MTAVDRNHLCRSALSAPLNQPVPPKAENDLQIQGRQIPRPRPALRNFIKETPLAGCGENGDDSNWKHCSWTHEQVGDGMIFWKLLDRLNPTIAELSQAIEQEVEKCREAQRRMTHPGVGPLTALAFVLIIGKAERFPCGKQIASYLGLVPLENSSGDRRRLGHITKQGSSMLRFLLVEAAQVTARSIPEWRSKYVHLMIRRGRKIAKVAMARRLAIALYWMWRKGWSYEQSRSSVRTRASSEQAMVCSTTPGH